MSLPTLCETEMELGVVKLTNKCWHRQEHLGPHSWNVCEECGRGYCQTPEEGWTYVLYPLSDGLYEAVTFCDARCLAKYQGGG